MTRSRVPISYLVFSFALALGARRVSAQENVATRDGQSDTHATAEALLKRPVTVNIRDMSLGPRWIRSRRTRVS